MLVFENEIIFVGFPVINNLFLGGSTGMHQALRGVSRQHALSGAPLVLCLSPRLAVERLEERLLPQVGAAGWVFSQARSCASHFRVPSSVCGTR